MEPACGESGTWRVPCGVPPALWGVAQASPFHRRTFSPPHGRRAGRLKAPAQQGSRRRPMRPLNPLE